LKEKIVHLGLGNKNALDLVGLFTSIKQFMETHHHFPQTIKDLTMNEGIGTKIALLVLYFVYGQNNAIPVDSHVIKCEIALKWVPPFCKSADAI